MSTFEVLVRTVDDVIDHPNADRLSIVKILGYEAITNKLEDGSHRFVKGEPVVYVPESAVIPVHVLKERGYWDEAKDKGMLAGKDGTRVKAIRLRSILSQGLVWKVESDETGDLFVDSCLRMQEVNVGDAVAEFFGITKYEPPIPTSMSGEVIAAHEFSVNFDIENEQNFPGFLDNDIVEATEKLHGTCARISFRAGVERPELFGKGGVAISSKGLGAKGLVFKNNESSAHNLYVRSFVGLGLVEAIESLGTLFNSDIDLFGEIFGRGVQDLHYGQATPTFRAFDIMINGRFADPDTRVSLFKSLGVEQVPVLYRGKWDRDALVAVRDGKTTLGEGNVREGVVVTACGDQAKRAYMNHNLRPMLKMINPDYLTRKGETTEFQ
jgi:RNA ligase (TIGR02306 family)